MRLYCALVHYPVRARDGSTLATAVTNLDVHDIARSAHVYGLRGYFVVTPITAQHQIVERILGHWSEGEGGRRIPERSAALACVRPVESVAAALQRIRDDEGETPYLIATAARPFAGKEISSYAAIAQRIRRNDRSALLLFGTGHGLADELLREADALLEPIRGNADYNHLSVRAAAAITFERLVGEGDAGEPARGT